MHRQYIMATAIVTAAYQTVTSLVGNQFFEQAYPGSNDLSDVEKGLKSAIMLKALNFFDARKAFPLFHDNLDGAIDAYIHEDIHLPIIQEGSELEQMVSQVPDEFEQLMLMLVYEYIMFKKHQDSQKSLDKNNQNPQIPPAPPLPSYSNNSYRQQQQAQLQFQPQMPPMMTYQPQIFVPPTMHRGKRNRKQAEMSDDSSSDDDSSDSDSDSSSDSSDDE